MSDYSERVKALRDLANGTWKNCEYTWFAGEEKVFADAAAAIEELQAEVKRIQGKLCDWCAVCPKERRNPDDCELLGENPVMDGARAQLNELSTFPSQREDGA